MPKLKIIILTTILTACTASKTDSASETIEPNQPAMEPSGEPAGEPATEPSGEPGDEPPWAPVNGHWTYGGGELIENTCSDDTGGGTNTDPAGFTLTATGGNEVQLVADGTTEAVTCVLNNMDFTCQKTNSDVTIPVDMGFENVDFQLNIETESNGFFTDDRSMTTLFTLTTTCLGVEGNIFGYDCADAQSDGYLPCVVRFSAEATAD